MTTTIDKPSTTQGESKIWDISPPLDALTPAFPGDTAYRQSWAATLGPGCPVNVGTITLSPHLGAHADAPLHYDAQGQAVGALDLAPFMGPCRVIHAMDAGALVHPHHLAHAIGQGANAANAANATNGTKGRFAAPLPTRVLVRTYQRMPQRQWDAGFCALAPETVTWLADQGVVLVGIDTASVDPADSKTLDSHQVLRQRNLRVLENLVLDDVDEGDYELIALPLKLMTADASPVRAVLRR